jgi:predicted aspartyl protease
MRVPSYIVLATALCSASPVFGQSCQLPSIADTAKLVPIPGSSLMTVPVAINGKAKQFLLDLGGGPTEVTQATAAELGLPGSRPTGSDTIQTGAHADLGFPGSLNIQSPVYNVNGSQNPDLIRPRVKVGAFTIGSATARNLQFIVSNDDGKTPYDGLLTSDFFKQYDLEVNFAGQEINYLTATKCTDPEQAVFWSHAVVAAVPITLANGKFQMPVTIDGHALNGTIDTTVTQTIMRREVAEQLFGLKPGSPDMAPQPGSAGSADIYKHVFKQVAFGGVIVQNALVLIPANSASGNGNRDVMLGSRAQSADALIPELTIGMDVLRHLHLYVVPGQGKMFVTAAE